MTTVAVYLDRGLELSPDECLDASIAMLASIDQSALSLLDSDAELAFTARLEQLGRHVDALRVAAATDIGERSRPGIGTDGLAASKGFRTAADLLEHVTGESATTVRRRLRIGGLVRHRMSDLGCALPPYYPATGEALSAGLIGLDVAETITRELAVAAPRAIYEDLMAAERALIAAATGIPTDDQTLTGMTTATSLIPLCADLIRDQARLWRDVLDPDGVEPRADEARERRDFSIGRTSRNGVHTVRGAITSDVAAELLAALDAALSPRTGPVFAAADEEEERGLAQDTRTPGQQRADVFAAMIHSFLGSDMFATSPAVIITVDAETVRAGKGTGTMTGITGPVPLSMIRQAVCDRGAQPVLIGAGGQIAAMDTTERCFTQSQRRAIVARDGNTCLIPGCRVPATGAEAHHVIPHSHGGPTSVANGVLLCWWHHHLIDSGLWTITMQNGVPRVNIPVWLRRTPYVRT
jgi:hypothetical protein